MVEIEITTMSSKGQIVIPNKMRKGFRKGERFVIVRAGKRFVLKPLQDLNKNLQEDLEFARRTEEAWKSYERGEFKSSTAKNFLKELEKC